MLRIAIAFGLLTLAGCGGSNSVGRSDGSPYGFAIVNPEQRIAEKRWIYVDFNTYREVNIVKRMDVAFSFEQSKRSGVAVVDLPTAERKILADNLSAGPRAKKSVFQKYAVAMARQTYCNTGPISLNRNGRSFSNPADIQRISNATGGQILGAKIPGGMKGTPVPAVEYNDKTTRQVHIGPANWTVHLLCNAPYPYGG